MDYGGGRSKIIKIIFLVVVIGIGVFVFLQFRGHQIAVAGIKDPIQGEASGNVPLKRGKYTGTISFIKSYDISAIVVSTKKYSGTSLADAVSSKDVALAWGKVAEYNKKIDFNWSQSGRWCHWSVDDIDDIDVVGGVDGVTRQMSNNHLIAASSAIEKKIKKIKTGDYVRITGFLVNVDASDSSGNGYWWYSSTSRDDTGDGACEIIYVKDVVWLK